ncbi:S8 family serine peptidase [Halalkalibacterium halodurans]|uniref:S8 family serine peptidase n=1 Tax=Halalkalibacterium halodurans TaxID=86665 RepID=UPI002E237E83|nr:S8 family serine peptidase [Halalkalibacterium halodurans]MED4163153.1 S8 family serine peptidase [Halalkalibacterium halodurans]
MKRHLSIFMAIVLIFSGIGFSLPVSASKLSVIDGVLQKVLEEATAPVEVIVTFEGDGAPTTEHLNLLKEIGITTGVTLENLPIAGVLATAEQVELLSKKSNIRSLYYNSKVDFENAEATALTGVDRVRTDGDMQKQNGGFPVSGKGVTVVVNDSGVDGTHDDHKFGNHLVQNVLASTNLNALSGLLPITYVEGVPNTDNSSGHGTHVAGTVGGTGAKSGGLHEGVAPGAGLIGYGSGAGVAILDTIGGFDYALTNQLKYDIRVITNSWGATSDAGTDFDPNHPVNVATKKLFDRGIVTVFSAGNSGPGESTITGNYKKAPWVITVAAGTKQGNLTNFSSRGVKGKGGTVTVDGKEWTWEDRPTVTAPGQDIISTRVISPTTALSVDKDAELIEPAHLPYYTTMSGTSMAAPHVAGIVALILEADPTLSPLEVKEILQNTATNMPGYQAWEVGAGYVNAYAAVDAALTGKKYGQTVNMNKAFHAHAQMDTKREAMTIDYNPLLGGNKTIKVEKGLTELIAKIDAKGLLGETGNTVRLTLVDPEGNEFSSGIPVLFTLSTTRTVQVPAPTPGTWTVKVDGLNGLSLPETIQGELTFNRASGFSGIDDIANHPAEAAIQVGVTHRLIDGLSNGKFRPDRKLTRAELAEFLVMGTGVRQYLSATTENPYIDAVTAKGAALKDLYHVNNGVMRLTDSGSFQPNGSVSRAELAYSLVQSLGLQEKAQSHKGDVTVQYRNERVKIEDADQIPADLRGYVQLALDLNILHATFSVSQGRFDLQPTVHAVFKPEEHITRGDYAVAVTRYYATYLK